MCRARILSLLVLCSVWSLAPAGAHTAHGQTADGDSYTLVLRGVPMHEALEALARLTEIDLVYSTELVTGKHVYCNGRDRGPEALLQCLLDGSGLDYVRSSSGAYILIEAVEAPPRVGHLAGSVIDRETGAPLPYANVLLADASTGTTTNEAGLFSFASVLSGPHQVVVTYLGYQTTVDSVWVGPGARQRMRIALRPAAVAMEPVLVSGLEQRLPSEGLGRSTLSGRDVTDAYGVGTPDVARHAGGFTGVAVQQPLADLHIQGSGAGEHLTLLDGVPVRDPVSLGRHLGAFSPLALDRLTVHKAGFGAEHGSHLSGVITVEHEVAAPAGPEVVLSADPVSFNGRAQARLPLPAGMEGTAMAALRTSAWSLYKDPGISMLLRRWNALDPLVASRYLREEVRTSTLVLQQYRPDVLFSDAHAAVRVHLSPFRILHASAYRARNRLSSELAAANADSPLGADHLLLTRDAYDWTNWVGQVRHSWILGARSVALVQAQGSWNFSRNAYDALHGATAPLQGMEDLEQAAAVLRPGFAEEPATLEQNQIRELSLKGVLTHSLSPHHQAEVALTATHTDSRLRLRSPFVVPLRHDVAAWELSGYLKDVLTVKPGATLEPSLRLTYLPLRQTLYAEPRLSVRYDGSVRPFGGYALRVAGGLYRQFTNEFALTSVGLTSIVPYTLIWMPLDRSLAPPRAYHLAADALLTPGTRWTIGLEAYHKWQPHLLLLDYAALSGRQVPSSPEPSFLRQDAIVGAGRGRAYGAGLQVQRKGPRFSHEASYSFSYAVRRFPSRFDGRPVPMPWNEPHRLTLEAEAALTSAFRLGVHWEGGWGRRWALRRAYYDYLALRTEPSATAPYDLHDPSQQAVPPYYRLDAGLTFEQTWKETTFQVRAALINVLNRQNVYDWSLEPNGTGVASVARTLPGRYPVFSLRLAH